MSCLDDWKSLVLQRKRQGLRLKSKWDHDLLAAGFKCFQDYFVSFFGGVLRPLWSPKGPFLFSQLSLIYFRAMTVEMWTQASFLVTVSWENVLENWSNCPYAFMENKSSHLLSREQMPFVSQTSMKVDI